MELISGPRMCQNPIYRKDGKRVVCACTFATIRNLNRLPDFDPYPGREPKLWPGGAWVFWPEGNCVVHG